MNNKSENLKEKLKQALSSTARVISDDLEIISKKDRISGTLRTEIARRNWIKIEIKTVLHLISFLLLLNTYDINNNDAKPIIPLPKANIEKSPIQT